MNYINFKSNNRRIPELASNLTTLQICDSPLELKSSSWCTPFSLTPVAALSHKIKKSINIDHSSNDSTVYNYLKTISFPQGSNSLTFNNKSFLPLTHIESKDGMERLNEACTGYINSLFGSMIDNTRSDIRSCLQLAAYEITTNVMEHSNAENYWICAQFYKSESILEFCIVDDGIGILERYVRQGIMVKNSEDAIKEALQGLSVKAKSDLPGDRGQGLGKTVRVITGSDFCGDFCLISGDCVFLARYKNHPHSYSFPFFWNGVIICCRVKIPEAKFEASRYY